MSQWPTAVAGPVTGRNGCLDRAYPDLASRLGLSRPQRDELRLAIENKIRVHSEGVHQLLHAKAAMEKLPGGEAQSEQMVQAFKDRLNEMDEAIWNVRRPNQARELRRILGPATPLRPRAPAKVNTSRRAG